MRGALSRTSLHSESISQTLTLNPYRQVTTIRTLAPRIRHRIAPICTPIVRHSIPVRAIDIRLTPAQGLIPRQAPVGRSLLSTGSRLRRTFSRLHIRIVKHVLIQVRVQVRQRTIRGRLQTGSYGSLNSKSVRVFIESALPLTWRKVRLRAPPCTCNTASSNGGYRVSRTQADDGDIAFRRRTVVVPPITWAISPTEQEFLLVFAFRSRIKARTSRAIFTTGFQGNLRT